ncbi:MAG: RagB/SusD family nutrient uptake outer membrane protein [Prevotellaceae bacterium]|jgi:hypothetical protein|nr:RagB/SusD family nutrient uptake outer membrane protein [Prevotellaceae bacterium]
MKNMKYIAIGTIAGALLLTMNACEDFLDAPSKSAMEAEELFSTPTYAERSIAGVIQSFGETNSYRGRYLVYYGLNTDVEVQNSMSEKNDNPAEKERLVNYNTNATNDQMNTDNNAYAKFYEGIERANLAIANIRQYGDVENNADMAQILGELLTLRAVVYSDLLKGWGNVPARFDPVTAETAYLPRADRDVILKQLLADLEEAAKLVGWPNENSYTTSTEHVNKCFVKGLRARIALIAGGYSLHVGESQMRLSTDPDLGRTEMYAIAKNECLDVINNGYAKLQPGGFEAAFKAVHAETYVAGNETLWELPFSEGRGRVIFDLGVKHTTTDKYTGQAKGGANGPNPVMFYKYEKEDVRRDVTCIPYEWTNGKQVPTNLDKWYFGKYRYEWLNRVVTSTNDDGLNYLYMRYAEVLLMAAEAINELEGPAAAAPYLQQIRARAYPNNPEKVSAFMATAMASKDAFFKAIVDERALEFCGEMLRKADLIRWNLLTAKLAENREDLQKLHNKEGSYASMNQKIYHKTASDGESVLISGLTIGETPNTAYTYSKDWKLQSDAVTNGTGRPYWSRLYVVENPSVQPYWPIWQYFIDNSNGKLANE